MTPSGRLASSGGVAGPTLAWAVDELLFPVGCALILYRAAAAERQGVAVAAAR